MPNASDDPGTPGENTYVFDPESPAELARLIHQDRLTTREMGGPLVGLTEQEIAGLRNVLDLACGPGGWVLDVAFEHPDFEVAGIDISRPMIAYANARAVSQELTNASFGVMDIRQPLDFAPNAFDLVNMRFVGGVLLRTDWPRVIAEATRLLRSGGILRLTEVVDWGTATTPAFERMEALLNEAAWRAGYGFSPDGRTIGITPMLPRLLRSAGYQRVQRRAYALELSAQTEHWADDYRNYEVAYLLLQPFLVKTGVISQPEVERLYQQMLAEMRAPDFCGMWHFLTVRGVRP
jgi:SAM-dependent methyltransferase